MGERILLAALGGVIQAVIVWVVSTALHARHVWPGTILAFAMGTITVLIHLRGRRG